MGRSPCCSKEGLNRGAWTSHEDKILKEYIMVHGEGKWRNLPKRAGLKRCGKSCRLRWLNYLRPNIKRGNISSDEEDLIIRLHKLLGNRWSLIAGRLPGRTDNEIKNYWNTNLVKKVKDGHHQHQITNNTGNPMPPKATPSFSAPKLDSNSSNVVRTKATKCSKLLFLDPPNNNNSTDQPRPFLQYDNGFLPADEDKEISTDFLIDFNNVGDICLSDLLNSDDCLNMCDLSWNNNQQPLSPCSDQTPIFSDQFLKDWTHTTNTSFLDSTAETQSQ
ncbi:hypothetical protein RJT34_33044 [Clitoria ternatea]|uniref:Myb-related protein 123 n=1 Tax=Clitoria ternatea TaxID=43366 RepID=A0AAN9EX51_CLITE